MFKSHTQLPNIKRLSKQSFYVSFDYKMICPYCKNEIEGIIECYDREKGDGGLSPRMMHTLTFLCPKCNSILGVTKEYY